MRASARVNCQFDLGIELIALVLPGGDLLAHLVDAVQPTVRRWPIITLSSISAMFSQQRQT